MKAIYTVTAICDAGAFGSRSRCWGWFDSEAEAKIAVRDNAGNMQESLYNFLVIQQYQMGVPTLATVLAWYEWGRKTCQWEPCECPDTLKNVCNFGMG